MAFTSLLQSTRALPHLLRGCLPSSIPSHSSRSRHKYVCTPAAVLQDGHGEKYAAIKFLDRVNDKEVTLEQLRREAPVAKQQHYEHLRSVDELQYTMIQLLTQLAQEKEETKQAIKDIAAQKAQIQETLFSLTLLVKEMEEREVNSGIRLVVEASLRLFQDAHLAGSCQHPRCKAFVQSLLGQGMITTDAMATIRGPNNTMRTVQMYRLTSQKWNRKEAIRHFAHCPAAKIIYRYDDRFGNTLISMTPSDFSLELLSRSEVVWDNLHTAHHVLDPGVRLKIPHGPNRNRADTLFYYSMCRFLNVECDIVREEKASTDIAKEIHYLAQKIGSEGPKEADSD